jgi:hypothetical protein
MSIETLDEQPVPCRYDQMTQEQRAEWWRTSDTSNIRLRQEVIDGAPDKREE